MFWVFLILKASPKESANVKINEFLIKIRQLNVKRAYAYNLLRSSFYYCYLLFQEKICLAEKPKFWILDK